MILLSPESWRSNSSGLSVIMAPGYHFMYRSKHLPSQLGFKLITVLENTVDPKSADFLNVKNRALYAECWQNPTIFSMNPHPQLTPVCRRGADSAILDADVWQNLDVMRIFRTFGVHREK
ncbi:hypothetical protein AG1IA_00652 [Rhizoctonia solani AG-1 IA]|uniref:Uncharacterized protein n=1 Tax=Thanatephorus cucumeris (strain AG1-IA) TaxID=983506 RepID=L8X552_THACA|nr:hypothetical protein AG1IA_00652 [Rhizoctonia solani AG-1 IA]